MGADWKRMINMNKLPFNWFDIFLLVWLALGIYRGRKRGMSEELLTFLQWIVTVVVCAFAYQPIGNLLSSKISTFGRLSAYVTGYLLAATVVAAVFLVFKRLFHGKLIGSDAFGKAEYYLGMPAGMVRFICMLLAGLALLNARLYSPQEIKAERDYQMKNYDSEFFPTFQVFQASVFEKSFTGPYIKKYLSVLLITPTSSAGVKQFKQKEWNPGI